MLASHVFLQAARVTQIWPCAVGWVVLPKAGSPTWGLGSKQRHSGNARAGVPTLHNIGVAMNAPSFMATPAVSPCHPTSREIVDTAVGYATRCITGIPMILGTVAGTKRQPRCRYSQIGVCAGARNYHAPTHKMKKTIQILLVYFRLRRRANGRPSSSNVIVAGSGVSVSVGAASVACSLVAMSEV